jgi:hypothetical protein
MPAARAGSLSSITPARRSSNKASPRAASAVRRAQSHSQSRMVLDGMDIEEEEEAQEPGAGEEDEVEEVAPQDFNVVEEKTSDYPDYVHGKQITADASTLCGRYW